MTEISFSKEDLKRLEDVNISQEDIEKQLAIFRKGFQPVSLEKPCTISDGIIAIANSEFTTLMEFHDKAAGAGRMSIFVPASGAASRMFKEWFSFLETENFDNTQSADDFLRTLDSFAFFDDLKTIIEKKGGDLHFLIKQGKAAQILSYILTEQGLNYGYLPKALLKFHSYHEKSRTTIEEHLVEGMMYARDAEGKTKIHFTVSAEYRHDVETYIASVIEHYQKQLHGTFDISVSIQLLSTDTIAVDEFNYPLRDSRNELILRPGGHGALLHNLNNIHGDIIFIKNIDNVVPDRLKTETVFYKKILGGYLMRLQQDIFRSLHLLSENHITEPQIALIEKFCQKTLNLDLPMDFKLFSMQQKKDFFFQKLNRPLRVCGMVKNQGEPGGGPFWIREKDGTTSLQIIEEAQIDKNNPDQLNIWKSSTHFNPVDIVCGIRNFRGEIFNLNDFIDKDTYFISQKSLEGRSLKALELPGLWNGSMAHWNTVFIEVPIITFNPVKVVTDLLRTEHQNIEK